MIKKSLQKLIRIINLIIFKRKLPNKISIYFHETNKDELDDIEEIIKYFKKLGYVFLTISNFNKNLNNNEKNLAITFDDGFSNWIDVIPIFDKYEIKSTFFMNTIQFTQESKEKFLSDIKCLNESYLINETDTEKIQKQGHEIGAHTHSHKTLKNINKEQFYYEINENIKILNSLNIYPKNFAVPFGMRRLIKKEQLDYLMEIFDSVSFGEPGMLFNQNKGIVQRYPWKTNKSFEYNLNNIRTDTSIFNKITKRSGLG